MSDWSGKRVFITGGSSGFGRALAGVWGRAGARIGLAARDALRLEAAAADLAAEGIQVQTRVMDVTSSEDVAALPAWVCSCWGGLDVFVACAGRSDRGLAGETPLKQYEDLWRLNFLATVHCSQLLLPLLADSRGSLVLVGSLASKIAAPYMGAYSASKFPLDAFAQQLRREPIGQQVHVLLVCPGPMERADAGTRYAVQSAGLPQTAGRPGGGARVKLLAPVWLAERVVDGCRRRKPDLVVPAAARFLAALQHLAPTAADRLLRRWMG